jgi:hypothetical protein
MTRPRVQLRCVTAMVAAALIVAAALGGSAGAAATARSITVYALATAMQFEDHSDDRQRGLANNPFNVDTKSVPPVFKKGTGKGGGQVGDKALYVFKLYSDPKLKKRIGSATYACTFNFGNRALCQADFEFGGGSMLATGPANFSSTSLTLAVSGGTGSYLGVRGQVSSAPHATNASRLTFVLR